jgi:fatty-acyl-CoA synthase
MRDPIDPRDLGAALRVWARRYGDRPAAIGEGNKLAFAQLDTAADAWAAALRGGRDTRIGLLGGNSPAWLAAAFGVWRAGATLVPISTFVTARELADVLAHADLSTLIVQPRVHSRDFRALLAELPAAVRRPRIVPLDGVDEGSPTERPAIDPEAIACILYTSGTTGRAKGVRLSHRAILATVGPTAERSGLTADDSLLSTLPLFWVAGLVIRALPTLATGCALILIERATPDTLLDAFRRHRPTALHLRPPQIGGLLAHPDFTPDVLARVCRGGGRVEWFHPHFDPRVVHMITGYGMTETAGYATALDWRDPPDVRAAQIGQPLPGVELRIVRADGQACAPDEEGDIRVRGPGLFSGYHGEPPGNGLDADGFFRTGDRGRIDAKGVFHFSGRSKDLLRVKGINVSPVEVETVLGAHPAIDAAYVVGLPVDSLEQEIVALVVPRIGAAAVEAEIRAFARRELSHYKCPTHYIWISRDEVPLSATSKPQREVLAALAIDRLKSRGPIWRH